MASYVTLTASEAKALAEAELISIKRCREIDRQKFLEAECKRQNNGFFHKLFRRKPVTPSDVIRQNQALDEYYANGPHFWRCSELWEIENISYGASKQLAERVLAAVRHGSTIQLSLEDMSRLSVAAPVLDF